MYPNTNTPNDNQVTAKVEEKTTTHRPVKLATLTALSIGCFILLAIGLVAFFYYQNQHLKNLLSKYTSPSPTPAVSTDPFSNWKTVVNSLDNYELQVPKEWKELPAPKGSGQVIFQSTDGLYRFTGSTQPNKNKVTGKSYSSLDEYVGLPYTVKALTVDNQDARQPLPRAGSEDTDRVNFFSLDSKQIFNLEMLVGDGSGNDHRVTVESIRIGSKIFDQILSSFKFLVPLSTCVPRPSCLDATPRCMIPETSDMCPPNPSATANDTVSSPSATACTTEAKICPDGSSVGRTGPKCEFAPCPTTSP